MPCDTLHVSTIGPELAFDIENVCVYLFVVQVCVNVSSMVTKILKINYQYGMKYFLLSGVSLISLLLDVDLLFQGQTFSLLFCFVNIS